MTDPSDRAVPPAPPPDEPALPDLGGLLEGFQKMQDAQATLYEGQAGGGVVRIAATGGMAFESVTIDPAAVDPDDGEMLEDLVLAALHDLATAISDAQRQAMGGLGDLDLGGLLGGAGPESQG
ncbi:hypothetical protein BH18ACT4_BH18ACT4_08830 [soil metagenome]